jgi:hypothetical protein
MTLNINQAVCNSFKSQLLDGNHDFSAAGGNTFKLALYTTAATLNATTTVYTSTNEVTGTGGTYSAGGGVLTGQTVSLDGSVGIVDFADLSFTGVTLSALGAVIYNTSFGSNAAVCVLDFGAEKTATSGTFTILFPAFTAAAAILRIA